MNWEEIIDLLNVVLKTREMPTLKPIQDLAMHELEEAVEEAAEELEKARKKKADEEKRKVEPKEEEDV